MEKTSGFIRKHGFLLLLIGTWSFAVWLAIFSTASVFTAERWTVNTIPLAPPTSSILLEKAFLQKNGLVHISGRFQDRKNTFRISGGYDSVPAFTPGKNHPDFFIAVIINRDSANDKILHMLTNILYPPRAGPADFKMI